MFINSKTRAVNLSLYIYIYMCKYTHTHTHTHTLPFKGLKSVWFFLLIILFSKDMLNWSQLLSFLQKKHIFLINYVILNYLFIKEPLSNQKLN